MNAGTGNGQQEGQVSLPFRTKLVYALGDHTVNLALFSLLSVFPAFLTEVAGVRPALAGLVPLIGRFVDAITDPAMGRMSDGTTWKAGRRRPYLLIGMVPFGLAFGALWWAVPGSEGHGQFAYYVAAYVLFSLASTVLAVPYLALIPEMTSSYDERTSMNAARAVGAILGALLAATLPIVAASFGGGALGYQRMGIAAGLYVMLPWFFVYAVTFERTGNIEPPKTSFMDSVRSVVRRKSYQMLAGLFLLGRIAIDLASSMFMLFFTYRMQRPEDFTPTLAIFMIMVAVALPIWAAIGRHTEKRTIFLFGCAWWIGSQTFLFVAEPDWPSWVVFLGAAIGGVGYAAADMIPWSMLGEVVDEDELESGERREGIYFGLFTFLRKLGGALGVAVAFAVLDWAGYRGGQPVEEAPVEWIRAFTAVIPGIFVLLAGLVALSYPLGRARHAEILRELDLRRANAADRS
ncbi:MAG: MFS transporter [bacterium]|nr:MFS transporter [bacterium]